MDRALKTRLKRLARARAVRVEYQCSTCGYMLYRRLSRDEVQNLLAAADTDRLLLCPGCGEEGLSLVGVSSEREWMREHPDYTHGG